MISSWKRSCFCISVSMLSVALYSTASAQSPLPHLKIVQLGDSYSAGNGARSSTGDKNYVGVQGCYRSPTNWGSQLATSLHPEFSITYINRACSGGVIADITNPRVIENEPPGPFCPKPDYPDEESWECTLTRQTRTLVPQIQAIDNSVDLVVMTAGGNDIHFADVVKYCFVGHYAHPADCRTAVEYADSHLETVKQGLISTFASLRGTGKLRHDAKVVLVTYPYLVPDDSFKLTDTNTGETYEVATNVRALGAKGDQKQSEAVAEANAAAGEEFVFLYNGTKGLFEGHLPEPRVGFTNPTRWIYEASFLDALDYMEWYHFNALGHQSLGQAASVLGTVGTIGGEVSTLKDLDVAFVVDTTGSMGGQIAQVRTYLSSLVSQLATTTKTFRVAVVSYRDYPARTGSASDYPARIDQTFTDDLTAIQAAINFLSASGGGDLPETVFSGIETALKLPWRPGVTKIALVIGDAPALSPEPISNYTPTQVAADSVAIDPVQIYGVNVGALDSNGALSQISSATGGAVVDGTSSLPATLSRILGVAAQAPYAFMGQAYSGKIGEPIEFDASGSDDPSGHPISLYEWDFNGDGVFEFQSTEPKAKHTYDGPFNDFVVVRATGTAGTALASARTVVNAAGFASQGNEKPCELDADGYSVITDTQGQFLRCTADHLPSAYRNGVIGTTNLAPIANAGPDATYGLGTKVILNGLLSSDPDHGPAPLGYSWVQTSGPTVALAGSRTGTPSFIPKSIGTYSFTLTVSDGELTSTDSVTITIVFNFTGFFPPVANPNVWNSATAGTSVPLKFSLHGNQGMTVVAPGSPTSGTVACTGTIAVNTMQGTTTAGGSSLSYDSRSDSYNYVWKTSASWRGTCRLLQLKLSDNTVHQAVFNLAR